MVVAYFSNHTQKFIITKKLIINSSVCQGLDSFVKIWNILISIKYKKNYAKNRIYYKIKLNYVEQISN